MSEPFFLENRRVCMWWSSEFELNRRLDAWFNCLAPNEQLRPASDFPESAEGIDNE